MADLRPDIGKTIRAMRQDIDTLKGQLAAAVGQLSRKRDTREGTIVGTFGSSIHVAFDEPFGVACYVVLAGVGSSAGGAYRIIVEDASWTTTGFYLTTTDKDGTVVTPFTRINYIGIGKD